jgi:hypothetical protein
LKFRQFEAIIVIVLLILSNFPAFAQLSAIHDFRRADSVLVIAQNNDTLLYPFAGGMNSCQFMNLDVNLDGIDDLVVFDRHGYRILPFILVSASPVKFRYAPEMAAMFPPIEQWMQAVDYNHDSRKDIFTYTTGGIKVYRNDSENTLKFTQVTQPFLLSQQGTTLTNILVTYADYPAIVDIDNDGDYDVLTFWGLGSFMEWHKNTSMERYGNSDSLTFEKMSSCWGHFAEGNESNAIILDTCANSGNNKQFSGVISDDPKHTGSTILAQDLNADGLPDLVIGDVDFSTLIQLTNGGTLAEATMISQTTDFPNSADPVNLNTFPAAMLADVNNDGKNDLLVSPFDPSLIKGENFESNLLYLNSGTDAQPDYVLASNSFLQNQMIDFGSGAYPIFFDYNNDGLMDMLVGNYGYSDTCIYSPETGLQCTFSAKIALLLNVGTSSKPAFRLADRNIAHLDLLQMQSLIPTLADMDGDGDFDLVCGNSKGKLVYCENTALPGQPAEFKLVDQAWQSIDVGDFSAPQLIDIDHDGLTDMVCGKRDGTLSFYRNAGTIQQPVFTLITSQFGGVDITNNQLSNYGYSVPCFYEDNKGETLLFTGSEFGDIYVFDQIDNNLEGNFHLIGTIPWLHEGWRTGLTIGNLNNDTLSDMIVGNYSGGMGLFFGKPGTIFGIGERPSMPASSMRFTPNPAQNKVIISFSGIIPIKPEALVIQGIDEKIIMKYSISDSPLTIDISTLKNGIYLVTVRTNQGIVSGKLVICR